MKKTRLLRVLLVIACAAWVGCASAADSGGSGALTPVDLRAEYHVNPLAINTTQPRLSWELAGSARGQLQTAYRVLVANSPETLASDRGDKWDSGKVPSDQSIHVAYSGSPLSSNKTCWWKVRVWDSQGQPSRWSRAARWSTGLLNPSDWKGKWIGLDEKEPPAKENELNGSDWIWFPEGQPEKDAPVGTRWFRRTVDLPDNRPVVRARAAMTGDNQMVLYLNGNLLGKSFSFKHAPLFDVTDSLRPGRNTLAASVFNGGEGPNPAGFIGTLIVEFQEGPPIVVRTDQDWRVSDKEEAGWNRPDHNDSAWKAAKPLGKHGIGPWETVGVAGTSRRLPARMLRSEFKVDKKVRRAVAYVAGLGYYELEINGRKIGDRVLDPALAEYPRTVFYVAYDILHDLKQGANAVGVHLGNGRYYAPRLEIPMRTITYGYPKLLLQIEIAYEDGSTARVVSDGSWKITADGPILANNDYDGEEYDARKEMTGWSNPGFDDSKWREPQLVEAPKGSVVAQMVEPMRVTQTLKPISVKELRPGVWIYDMGQNMVGWCRLTVQGPEGTRVQLRHAETLRENGELYVENLRSAKAKDIYVLKGEGVEVYEPRFSYHGFRYVEMQGYPGKPDLNTIAGRVVHTDLDWSGNFSCSHPLLNRLYRNITWGLRGNYLSIPTDCPQRDERHGWQGDRALESKGESYVFDLTRLYAKWVGDIRDTQLDTGAVCHVAPAYWPFYNPNVTWQGTYLIIPDWFYDHYGDKRLIEEHYPTMRKWIAYMHGHLKEGIIPVDSYGDWCVPPEDPQLIHSKDPARITAKPLISTSYYCYVLGLMARYADILGKKEDAAEWRARAEQIGKNFNEKFFKPAEAVFDNGTQTSSLLPLAFGLVPKGKEKAVFDNLVRNIEVKTKKHIGTGLVGGQWLTRTLSDRGRADLVFTLATNKDYPSWGYMIEKDATTIWELWNGDTADPAMNSHNHVMLVGDLVIWLYGYLGGILPDPDGPGFRRLSVKPYVVGDLTYANASLDTVRGTVSSRWTRDDNSLTLHVDLPANSEAKVGVPTLGWKNVTIRERGEVIWSRGAYKGGVAGITAGREDGPWVTFDVGSGSYRFEVTK